MQNQFEKYLSALIGKPEQKNFLLAVSGGVDSVVMADLFKKTSFQFAIAHCNFQLRGDESEGDEHFVKHLAEAYKVPFFAKRFETNSYAEKNKVSIQMAARELRYGWLKECMTKDNFDYVVIAHQADDAIETFFINLLRGTGIAGLHGISSVHDNVIRPLLCFSRKEIEDYAKAKKLKWREDSSNASDKYERNKIRHHLIPELLKISPDATHAIRHTIEHLRETEAIYRKTIEDRISKLVAKRDGKIYFSLEGYRKLEYGHVYLYETIKDYGFNHTQAKEIIEAMEGQSGKIFLSESHQLIKDRKHLVLVERDGKKEKEESRISITDMAFSNGEVQLTINIKDKHPDYKPFHPPSVASLDYDKLIFPLTVRKWAKGDKFCPLGMKRPQKISDFLINNKISLTDKNSVYVMLSGNEIAWVIGHRIDERYKIVSTTKKLYICNIVNTQ
jgi:tRNA(Ile)-lysidine synthase